ncbi:MAG TPA: cytochrome c biogenesis protein CcdA [Candidatus Limnocylindrales bacterium]
MTGDLTILVAVGAGLLSFLSPCVLPLVPAYLGQLTAVAVAAAGPDGRPPSRWVALRHAVAYVLGFGLVFTLLGVTATFAGGPLFDALPALRQVGGVVLILLGLNLAGVLTVPALERAWRPLEAGASAARAGATGTMSLAAPASAGAPGQPTGLADRLGGRLAGSRFGPLASFGLGVIFAVGWTPCIGAILGAILTLAASAGQSAQGGVLLAAYTLGLGLPFLALGLVYDRAPALLRPLVRHGRAVSVVGGLLVMAIGVAMLANWLVLLPRFVPLNSSI